LVRTALNIRQSSQPDHRHIHQAKQACGSEPAVARNHVAVRANEDRIGESEGPDAAGDLGDLRLAVSAGIARGGEEPLDRPEFQAQPLIFQNGKLGAVRRAHHRSSVRSTGNFTTTPPTLNFAAFFSWGEGGRPHPKKHFRKLAAK
jgi:hypothetical protein